MIVAVLSVVAGNARLGFLGDLLSEPVLVGYIAVVAGMRIVGQLDNLTGVPADGGFGRPPAFAALQLIDVGPFRHLAAFRRSEALIAVATTSRRCAPNSMAGASCSPWPAASTICARTVRVLDRVRASRVFITLPTAVQAYAAWYRDRHATPLPSIPHN